MTLFFSVAELLDWVRFPNAHWMVSMGPRCRFCKKRCFVRFLEGTPDYVLRAYGRYTLLATCSEGQAFERERIGFCFDDIKRIIEIDALMDGNRWWQEI